MPRLFRESPLTSIWAGSGNIPALDVLRALAREPQVLAAFEVEVNAAAGADARLDAAVRRLRVDLAGPAEVELRARHVVERLALVLPAGVDHVAIIVRATPKVG